MELNIRGQRVLAIGAHPDDVEFGCFGVLSAAAERHVLVLSDGARGGDAQTRLREAQQSAGLISTPSSRGPRRTRRSRSRTPHGRSRTRSIACSRTSS